MTLSGLLLLLCGLSGCGLWEARCSKVASEWGVAQAFLAQASMATSWSRCMERTQSGCVCGPPPVPAVTGTTSPPPAE